MAVRNSRHPDTALEFTGAEWHEFLKGVAAGEFNL
jgi:hypothetical protein